MSGVRIPLRPPIYQVFYVLYGHAGYHAVHFGALLEKRVHSHQKEKNMTTNTNQSAPPEFSGVSTIVEKRGGEELAWLANLCPLPSPEELAEPLVEAICGLWTAFEDHAVMA
jgi:hypothetical protein